MASDSSEINRPGRPFGVTIAILISVLFFSVLPLLFVGMRVAIEDYVTRPKEIILPDGTVTTDAGLSGIEESAFTSAEVVFQVGVSLAFVVVAVFAWRGRPKYMRFVLMVSVLLLAGILIFQQVTGVQDANRDGGSLDNIVSVLLQGQVIAYIILPLYVVWYLNRAPARAFYRGYYLPEEVEYLRELYQDNLPMDTDLGQSQTQM